MPEVVEVKQLIQQQIIPAFLQQVEDIHVMQTVSNAVYGAALMGLNMPLHQLLQDKPESIYTAAKPHELSITLYAAALSNDLQQQELDQVLPGLLAQLPQLLPQHVANTLWAAATAGLQLQPQHLQQFVGALMQQPAEPQALGMFLWSVAKMDLTLPQQQVEQLVELLMTVLAACQPQTISNAGRSGQVHHNRPAACTVPKKRHWWHQVIWFLGGLKAFCLSLCSLRSVKT
jgi:hypothetical protein